MGIKNAKTSLSQKYLLTSIYLILMIKAFKVTLYANKNTKTLELIWKQSRLERA